MDIDILTIKNASGTGETRAYAHAKNLGCQDLESLAKEISGACTVTKSDIVSVLSALAKVAQRDLSRNGSFFLPEFGHFTLSLKSKVPEGMPIEKVNATHFTVGGINYKPLKSLLDDISENTHLHKSQYPSKSLEFTEEEMLEALKEQCKEGGSVTVRTLRMFLGQSRYSAQKWLDHFVEEGIMVKVGHPRFPVYEMKEK